MCCLAFAFLGLLLLGLGKGELYFDQCDCVNNKFFTIANSFTPGLIQTTENTHPDIYTCDSNILEHGLPADSGLRFPGSTGSITRPGLSTTFGNRFTLLHNDVSLNFVVMASVELDDFTGLNVSQMSYPIIRLLEGTAVIVDIRLVGFNIRSINVNKPTPEMNLGQIVGGWATPTSTFLGSQYVPHMRMDVAVIVTDTGMYLCRAFAAQRDCIERDYTLGTITSTSLNVELLKGTFTAGPSGVLRYAYINGESETKITDLKVAREFFSSVLVPRARDQYFPLPLLRKDINLTTYEDQPIAVDLGYLFGTENAIQGANYKIEASHALGVDTYGQTADLFSSFGFDGKFTILPKKYASGVYKIKVKYGWHYDSNLACFTPTEQEIPVTVIPKEDPTIVVAHIAPQKIPFGGSFGPVKRLVALDDDFKNGTLEVGAIKITKMPSGKMFIRSFRSTANSPWQCLGKEFKLHDLMQVSNGEIEFCFTANISALEFNSDYGETNIEFDVLDEKGIKAEGTGILFLQIASPIASYGPVEINMTEHTTTATTILLSALGDNIKDGDKNFEIKLHSLSSGFHAAGGLVVGSTQELLNESMLPRLLGSTDNLTFLPAGDYWGSLEIEFSVISNKYSAKTTTNIIRIVVRAVNDRKPKMSLRIPNSETESSTANGAVVALSGTKDEYIVTDMKDCKIEYDKGSDAFPLSLNLTSIAGLKFYFKNNSIANVSCDNLDNVCDTFFSTGYPSMLNAVLEAVQLVIPSHEAPSQSEKPAIIFRLQGLDEELNNNSNESAFEQEDVFEYKVSFVVTSTSPGAEEDTDDSFFARTKVALSAAAGALLVLCIFVATLLFWKRKGTTKNGAHMHVTATNSDQEGNGNSL